LTGLALAEATALAKAKTTGAAAEAIAKASATAESNAPCLSGCCIIKKPDTLPVVSCPKRRCLAQEARCCNKSSVKLGDTCETGLLTKRVYNYAGTCPNGKLVIRRPLACETTCGALYDSDIACYCP